MLDAHIHGDMGSARYDDEPEEWDPLAECGPANMHTSVVAAARQNAARAATGTTRRKDKSDRATIQTVLDPRTRMVRPRLRYHCHAMSGTHRELPCDEPFSRCILCRAGCSGCEHVSWPCYQGCTHPGYGGLARLEAKAQGNKQLQYHCKVGGALTLRRLLRRCFARCFIMRYSRTSMVVLRRGKRPTST